MTSVQTTPDLHTSFTLPYAILNGVKLVTDEKAPVTLRLRARLLSRYNGSFTISIGEGVTGSLTINETAATKSPVAVIGGYPASGESDLSADYTDITIRPNRNWLTPGQDFAAFRIGMEGYQESHENNFPPCTTTDVLIGIQRPG